MTIILIVLLVLLLGGGGWYGRSASWNGAQYGGGAVGLILLVLLVAGLVVAGPDARRSVKDAYKPLRRPLGDAQRVDPGTTASAVQPAPSPVSVRLKKGCMWITLNHSADDMAVQFLRTDGWEIMP